MTMMKPDERRAMRRQQIEQFLASDMGVMEWTKLNRMSTSTFYLWLHRFQDEDPETFGRREPKGGGWIELSRAELLAQLYENAQRLLNRKPTPWQRENA